MAQNINLQLKTINQPVADLTALNSLPVINRVAGSLVYVNDPGQIYRYTGSLWVAETLAKVIITDLTLTMRPNTSYIINSSALCILTLPTIFNAGDQFEIIGNNSLGWQIAQNASQTIQFQGSVTTSGVGGSLSSSNQYDVVEVTCITANTAFLVTSAVGNLTIV